MAVEALCPICGAVFSLKDEMQGKKVRCTKCEHVFTVGANGKAKERDEQQGVKTRADAGSKKSARDDDDDEDRPRKRAAAQRGRDDDDDEDDDRPRARKSKRVYHDDDDDDVDGKAKKRKDQMKRKGPGKKGSGAPVVALVVGGVVLAVLVLCGGGIFLVYRLAADAADEAQAGFNNGMQQNGVQPIGGGPDPFAGFQGQKQIANIDDALRDLKSPQPTERQAGAEWLARAPRDEAKAAEVSKALEPLVRDAGPQVFAKEDSKAAIRAMKVWATKDSVPTLVDYLKARYANAPHWIHQGEQIKDAMAALGRIGDERAVEGIVPFLGNVFLGDVPERTLRDMGPKAEKGLVKYYNNPNNETRNAVRRLLQQMGTKPDVILTQTLVDMRSADRDQRRVAVDWLAGAESGGARQQADAGKQKLVATALDNLLTTDTDFGIIDATMRALTNGWATTDSVPTLVQCVQNDRFPKRSEAITLLGKLKDARGAGALASRLPTGDRGRVAEALIAMGPVARSEVEKYIDHPDKGVQNEAARILRTYGGDTGNIELKQALANLKSLNGGQRFEAANVLARMKADKAEQDKVAAALAIAAEDGGDRRAQEEAIKALGVWGNKDSGLVLLRVLIAPEVPGNCKNAAVAAMKQLKDERVVKPLAAQLVVPAERANATRHLIALGPDFGAAIETEVKAGLLLQDKGLKMDCAKILGAVGTRNSLADLDRAQKAALALKPPQRDVAQQCADAIKAIELRK